MNPEPEAQLRTLHRIYCEETNNHPPYICCQRIFHDFTKQGFDESDLRLVAWHIKKANKQFNGGGFSMRLETLFRQDQDGIFMHFGSLLGEARGARRAADFKAKHSYPAAKAEVLRATGRSDTPEVPPNCISAADAIRRLRESV